MGACGSTQGSDLAAIRSFHLREPRVELAFRGVSTPRICAQLADGEFDICYADAASFSSDPRVRFACPEERSLCLMAHCDNPLAHRGPVTFEEAMAQTLIFAEPDGCAGQFAEHATGRLLRTDTQENVQLMLRLNMGVAIVPDSVATSASDDIAIVPTKGPWPTITLAWAYMEDNTNPALALFLEHLRRP